MVFSYLGFTSPNSNVLAMAITGAGAATLGRATLARLAQVIIRNRLLSEAKRKSIDAIREELEGKKALTFTVFLFYAFSPLPSNYLFIAYGLTQMRIWLVVAPFFFGRAVSYSLWGFTSAVVARRLPFESVAAIPYLSVYFVASQVLLLYLVYLFTKLDWRALVHEKKIRWIGR